MPGKLLIDNYSKNYLDKMFFDSESGDLLIKSKDFSDFSEKMNKENKKFIGNIEIIHNSESGW